MNFSTLRKANQRGLTSFFAKEHFLDFYEGKLDLQAEKEFRVLIDADVQLRLEYERFEDALKYCQQLSQLELREGSQEEIFHAPNALESFTKYLRLNEWPPGLRWGIEAVIVAAFLTIGIFFIPWNYFVKAPQRNLVTLTEVHRSETKTTPEIGLQGNEAPGAVAQYEDEGVKPTATPVAVAVTAAPKISAEPNTSPTKELPAPKAAEVSPTITGPVPIPPESVTQKVTAKASATAASPSAAPLVESAPSVAAGSVSNAGFLYRGTIQVRNIDPTNLKFVEFITNLGGRKAGEVELGWTKGSTRYFHFTIPEAKYEELKTFAKEYGQLVISKEPHPRKMPDGIARIILVVSEKGGP